MKDSVLSVAVISYNQEKYIEQTMGSVLRQKTNFPVEVLVADDASDDGTQKILCSYGKRFSHVYLTLREDNVGPTRNAYDLLMKARGKYIASIEGDDFFATDDFFQRSVDFLETHPEYIAVQDKCRVVDENGSTKENVNGFWTFSEREFSLANYLEWKMPGHLSAMVYRNIYRAYPDDYTIFYRLHPCIGDRTILMLLMAKGKIYCNDDISLCYRFVEKTENDNWMSQWKKANKRYEEFCLICSLERELMKRAGKETSMEHIRRSKIAAAAITAMLSPSRENVSVCWSIIRHKGNILRNIQLAAWAIIQKWYWRLRGQPGHRVRV